MSLYYDEFELQTLLYQAPEVTNWLAAYVKDIDELNIVIISLYILLYTYYI